MDKWSLAVSIGWLSFVAGMAVADIGETPATPEPMTAWSVIKVMFVLVATWLMGLWTAKSKKEAAND